ncbi:MAG: hypothetical protein ABI162_08245 [Luteolibacter sp.]
MNKSTEPNRFPAWLRGWGWLAFGILGLATVILVGRWLVMNSGHEATMRIVNARRKLPPPHALAAPIAPAAAPFQPAAAHGMPLSAVLYFGNVLTGDKKQWDEFSTKLREIGVFLQRYPRVHSEFVDGVTSFRAILQNMGAEVPETMTEAEAAAKYLKLADRFSSLLAQWREAVAKGHMDGGTADDVVNPGIYRFRILSVNMALLLTMTAEAHLQTGDAGAAWADWQTMKNSADRVSELFSFDMKGGSFERNRMFELARSGLRSGAWTDDQLAEISSEVARENFLAFGLWDQEREKASLADYYNHFQEHEKQIRRDILETPSPVNKTVNQLTMSLTTDQQIRDNVDLMLSRVDQRLSYFDPETGFYMRPTEEEIAAYKESQKSSSSPYFIYANAQQDNGDPDQSRAEWVIHEQSEYDQFRLAAALETYQHRTGSYPDSLDAIGGSFPDGAPRDIATGQPYLYQRDAEGGYKLWGTGIDGKSEGGNEKTDITWKHRPVKRK